MAPKRGKHGIVHAELANVAKGLENIEKASVEKKDDADTKKQALTEETQALTAQSFQPLSEDTQALTAEAQVLAAGTGRKRKAEEELQGPAPKQSSGSAHRIPTEQEILCGQAGTVLDFM